MSAAARHLYRSAWSAEPAVVVVAPGRVNLMGDHVDYAGLPVLPMAIQLGLQVAAGPAGRPGLEAISDSFPGKVVVGEDEASVRAGGWGAYVAAVLRQTGTPEGGVRIAVSGDLPSTGGLSSSSALVLGTLAAITAVAGHRREREDLVDMAVAAERSLGVAGGTMDQTVIVHACDGAALRVDFEPPAYRPVPIGEGAAFVVASSGDVAAKGSGVRHAYNRLSAAATAVARLVGPELGVPDARWLGRIGLFAPGLEAAVEQLPEMLSGPDLEQLAGVATGSLGAPVPVPVRRIGRHLVNEARRVDDIEAPLTAGDVGQIGEVFRASHASLASIGVVTDGLDHLTAAMMAAGATGARVTGAGFGGYAVGVCAPGCVDAVRRSAVEATGGPAWEVHPRGGLRYD